MLTVHFVGSTFDLCVQSRRVRGRRREKCRRRLHQSFDKQQQQQQQHELAARQAESCGNWYIYSGRSGHHITRYKQLGVHRSLSIPINRHRRPHVHDSGPDRKHVTSTDGSSHAVGGLTRKHRTSPERRRTRSAGVGIKSDRSTAPAWRGVDARMVRKLLNDEKYYGLRWLVRPTRLRPVSSLAAVSVTGIATHGLPLECMRLHRVHQHDMHNANKQFTHQV